MNHLSNNYSSIQQLVGQIHPIEPHSKKANGLDIKSSSNLSFEEILQKTKGTGGEEGTKALKFSKHANQRLESRNIELSGTQMERLENGTQKAREKGINESLVMVDNLAFIVNVKNNTVVTAVNDLQDSIFTNIDGAVIS